MSAPARRLVEQNDLYVLMSTDAPRDLYLFMSRLNVEKLNVKSIFDYTHMHI